jgi:hypothetical protein
VDVLKLRQTSSRLFVGFLALSALAQARDPGQPPGSESSVFPVDSSTLTRLTAERASELNDQLSRFVTPVAIEAIKQLERNRRLIERAQTGSVEAREQALNELRLGLTQISMFVGQQKLGAERKTEWEKWLQSAQEAGLSLGGPLVGRETKEMLALKKIREIIDEKRAKGEPLPEYVVELLKDPNHAAALNELAKAFDSPKQLESFLKEQGSLEKYLDTNATYSNSAPGAGMAGNVADERVKKPGEQLEDWERAKKAEPAINQSSGLVSAGATPESNSNSPNNTWAAIPPTAADGRAPASVVDVGAPLVKEQVKVTDEDVKPAKATKAEEVSTKSVHTAHAVASLKPEPKKAETLASNKPVSSSNKATPSADNSASTPTLEDAAAKLEKKADAWQALCNKSSAGNACVKATEYRQMANEVKQQVLAEHKPGAAVSDDIAAKLSKAEPMPELRLNKVEITSKMLQQETALNAKEGRRLQTQSCSGGGSLDSAEECRCKKAFDKTAGSLNPAQQWELVKKSTGPDACKTSRVRQYFNNIANPEKEEYQRVSLHLLVERWKSYLDQKNSTKKNPQEEAKLYRDAKEESLATAHLQSDGITYAAMIGQPSPWCSLTEPDKEWERRQRSTDRRDDMCRSVSAKFPQVIEPRDRQQLFAALLFSRNLAETANRANDYIKNINSPQDVPCQASPAGSEWNPSSDPLDRSYYLQRFVDTEREIAKDGREILVGKNKIVGEGEEYEENENASPFITSSGMNGLYRNLMQCNGPHQLGSAYRAMEKELRRIAIDVCGSPEARRFEESQKPGTRAFQDMQDQVCNKFRFTDVQGRRVNFLTANIGEMARLYDLGYRVNDCKQLMLNGKPVGGEFQWGERITMYHSYSEAAGTNRCPQAADEQDPVLKGLPEDERKLAIHKVNLHNFRVGRNGMWVNQVERILWSNLGAPPKPREIPINNFPKGTLLEGASFTGCAELIDTHRVMMRMSINRMSDYSAYCKDSANSDASSKGRLHRARK